MRAVLPADRVDLSVAPLLISEFDRRHHGISFEFDLTPRRVDRNAFVVGDTSTLSDCCLVPQLFNVRRLGVDMDRFPALRKIEKHREHLDALCMAQPVRQLDFE
ncbi:glutathione binding-like protein [Paraburkholderia hospita]|uniref:glutathione binding-like protein n=1 Tax=Paraburkholderia hospita TaxID=169430 RepID=UPI000271AD83|nr:glutathione binding-like protein [Paraburkholderia hospita]EUC18809.1 Glutathione S-transferase domain-containing protein [Burkholderia sp. BT03]